MRGSRTAHVTSVRDLTMRASRFLTRNITRGMEVDDQTADLSRRRESPSSGARPDQRSFVMYA